MKRRNFVAALVAALTLTWQVGAQAPATWTVNGDEMPLREFIAQVQAIVGKTIIVDQRSRQSNQVVTVLSNVPLDADGVYQLFLAVLKVHDLVAVEEGGIVSIVQNVRAKTEGGTLKRVTTVVPLDHVPASEALKVLRPMSPQTGHIAAIEKPNVLILSDYETNLRRLQEVIAHIDVLDRDEIVHRVLEYAWVGSVAAVLEEIAPDELGPNATGPQRVQIVANERNNSLVLRGKSRPIAEALRLIDQLDTPETTTSAAQVFYLNHADATATRRIAQQPRQRRRRCECAGGEHPGGRIAERAHHPRRPCHHQRVARDRQPVGCAPSASAHRGSDLRDIGEPGGLVRRRTGRRRRTRRFRAVRHHDDEWHHRRPARSLGQR